MHPAGQHRKPNSWTQEYFLLVDGLDELEQSSRDDLLNELKIFDNLSNVHILLTSRAEPGKAGLWNTIPFDIENVKKDIGWFVDAEIQARPQLQKLLPITQQSIRKRLVDQINDM